MYVEVEAKAREEACCSWDLLVGWFVSPSFYLSLLQIIETTTSYSLRIPFIPSYLRNEHTTADSTITNDKRLHSGYRPHLLH